MTEPRLNNKKLPFVQQLRMGKRSGVIPLPLVAHDSESTQVFDLMGNSRIITITGMFVGSLAMRQDGDVDYHGANTIDAIINADQDAIEFVADEMVGGTAPATGGGTGTKNVKIASFDLVSMVNRHFAVWDYILELVEADTEV